MNNSLMKCIICNNEKSGRYITINGNKYHICCIEHQKKIIDRLSRKIQRLKRDNKMIDSMCLVHWNLIDRQQKAIKYIKDNMIWCVGSDDLIKILEGKDE